MDQVRSRLPPLQRIETREPQVGAVTVTKKTWLTSGQRYVLRIVAMVLLAITLFISFIPVIVIKER